MLISNKVVDAINEQIGNEFGASLQYVAIAAHFSAEGGESFSAGGCARKEAGVFMGGLGLMLQDCAAILSTSPRTYYGDTGFLPRLYPLNPPGCVGF